MASEDQPVSRNLARNLERIEQEFSLCSDIKYRRFTRNGADLAVIVFLDGLVDINELNVSVLQPLIEYYDRVDGEDQGEIKELFLPTMQLSEAGDIKSVVLGVLKGQTALLTEGGTQALLIDLIKMEQRSITEPTSERVIRGPRDAFVESIRTNISLIRRRIRTPRLKIETVTIGELTQTEVAIIYIEGVAKKPLVGEVRERLKRIKIDALIHSANIEEFLEETHLSPFPQFQNTERPDVAVSSLVEGKIVLIVDHSPFVLIVPMNYWAGLQGADDYAERAIYGTFVRWIRYAFVHITLILPSLYVALTTFHPQVIPTSLVINIASAREGIPFPAVIEALIMELIFEGIREAGIRLPVQVGSAVSIAGALVIGQAVVAAGLVSTPMIIIVSLTGIASFAFPVYSLGAAYRMLRFPLLIIASILGFYGIMLFMILLSVHMVTLKPLGVPYMLGTAPSSPENLNDILIRAPRPKMRFRLGDLTGRNKARRPEK